MLILQGQRNLFKVGATNFRLTLGRVVLFVCQIWEPSCFQNKVFNNCSSNLRPKKCVKCEKNNKIWWLVPWVENDFLIPFLLNVL